MAKRIARVEIDRTEYDALCDLRDGAHEYLKIKCLRLKAQYDEVIEINRQGVHRLATAEIALQAMRSRIAELSKYEPIKVDVAPPVRK